MSKTRQIKFRAWSPSQNDWLSSSDGEATFQCYEGGVSVITYEEYWTTEGGEPTERIKKELHEDAIVMQYTGLNDKNGVEIYEGDIVRKIEGGKVYTSEVVFGKRTLGFGLHVNYIHHSYFNGTETVNLYRDKFYRLSGKDEVIGNIHEHENLLK